MNQNTSFETDAYQIEKIAGMTDAYPYCMHRRDLTDFVVPWHWHEELELGYLECGASVIQTLHADYEIHAGEGFFINTNVMDRKYNARPGTPVREIDHIFHPIFLGGHFHSRFECKYLYPILKNQQLEVHIIRPAQPSGQALLQKLRALHDLQALPDTEFQTRSLLGECWLLLLQNIRESSPHAEPAPLYGQARIRSMLSFIHQHYPERITAAEIAASAHISEREALRCFQRLLRTTPSDYLLEYRLSCAQRLLTETSDTVTQIALATGFSDTAYFGKCFKRFCHMTPTQFRRSVFSPPAEG